MIDKFAYQWYNIDSMEREQHLEPSLRETPIAPSAISAAGYALVHAGVERGMDTWSGAGMVFAGRALDVVDGFVARKFNMESRLGARIDAGLDKIGMLKIVNHLDEKGIIPEWVRDGMIIQNTVNTAVTFAAQASHPEADLRPTKAGKLAMTAQGASLAGYTIGNLIHESHKRTAKIFRGAGHALAFMGIVRYGGQATHEYIKRI